MLKRTILSRILARTAVLALALGLVGLASLSWWAVSDIRKTTSRVRGMDAVAEAWGQVLLRVGAEENALHDYLRADTDLGRQPLISAVGSAEPTLAWLAESAPDQADVVAVTRGAYAAYTVTLRRLLAAGDHGDRAQAGILAEQAALAGASLRSQLTRNIAHVHLTMAEYLAAMDDRSDRLRTWAALAFGVDLTLLGICSVVLLGYQRRVERQASVSRHAALHDSLTGLANRTLLASRLADAVEVAARTDGAAALLLIDLDRFKQVNDTLGHHVGDVLLKQVSARLRDGVRNKDAVARLGGDEFAVVLPNVSAAAEAVEVAERLRDLLLQPVDLDRASVDVGASIGIALFPDHGVDGAELMQHADIAMYHAKRHHRGVSVYRPDLNDLDLKHLTLLSDLRRAIDHGELVMHYQPKADARTGQVRGVEALVRWQHPAHGLLGPGEFIPLAEQSELIEPLTHHVLDEVLRQYRRWFDDGLVVPVAVNVPARCLLDTLFADRVAGVLRRHGVPAGHLTLEIVESAVITNPGQRSQVLDQLDALGVRLAIDDFGTGYSSMAYLRSLPVHELKIDQSFVSNLASDPGSAAIVSTILDLAGILGLQTVAEGVEDEPARAALADLGCTAVQGHHLCRPVPAGELTTWLRQPRLTPAEPAAQPAVPVR